MKQHWNYMINKIGKLDHFLHNTKENNEALYRDLDLLQKFYMLLKKEEEYSLEYVFGHRKSVPEKYLSNKDRNIII